MKKTPTKKPALRAKPPAKPRGRIAAARKPTSAKLTTYQTVTIALHLLGGAAETVDTEDIAVKTSQIAPGRFTWRKYPEQIDLNSVLISLRHAKRASNGSLVAGEASTGWRLTVAGRELAERLAPSVAERAPRGSGLTKELERWARHERNRLLQDPAFVKFSEGRTDDISGTEAARFFNLDEYIRNDRRRTVIDRLRNVFAGDPEIGPAIRFLHDLIEGE